MGVSNEVEIKISGKLPFELLKLNYPNILEESVCHLPYWKNTLDYAHFSYTNTLIHIRYTQVRKFHGTLFLCNNIIITL